MRINNKSFLELCEAVNYSVNYNLFLLETSIYSDMLETTVDRIRQSPHLSPYEAITKETAHRGELKFDDPSGSNHKWIYDFILSMPNASLAEFKIPHTTKPGSEHTVHVGFVKNHPMSRPEHRGTYNIGFTIDGSETPNRENLDPTNMDAQKGIFSGILDSILAHALKNNLSGKDYSYGAINKSGAKWFGHMQSAIDDLIAKYRRPQ